MFALFQEEGGISEGKVFMVGGGKIVMAMSSLVKGSYEWSFP